MIGGRSGEFNRRGVGMMKDVVHKFSKPDDLVLHAFAMTLSTVKVSLLLSKHVKYVGCEMNSGCVEKSIAVLVESCACQLLNESFDLKGGED